MKFREFLNTCQNDTTSINIYFDDDDWEDTRPEFTFTDMREIDNTTLNKFVDAWYVDANFRLHVLLSL